MDFPVTRQTFGYLETWVDGFARALTPAEQVSSYESFRWQHPEASAEVVQVAKAVRAASGLRAALILADAGHTVECTTLLRTVADFSAEIMYLGEALLEGRLTPDQEEFVKQHFVPAATSLDEFVARERERYIGRRHIGKALRRLAKGSGGQADWLTLATGFLNAAYDGYVHGSNESAMVLYDANENSFMLRGHESPRHVCMAKVSVAAKLYELLNGIRLMAMTRGLTTVEAEVRVALAESG